MSKLPFTVEEEMGWYTEMADNILRHDTPLGRMKAYKLWQDRYRGSSQVDCLQKMVMCMAMRAQSSDREMTEADLPDAQSLSKQMRADASPEYLASHPLQG